MNGDRDDFTDVLETWLDEGSSEEDPYRILERALARVETTPQSRLPWLPRVPLIAFTAAAGAVVTMVGISLLAPQDGLGGPPTTATPSPSEALPPSISPQPLPSQIPEVDPYSADYTIGRHSRTVDGVALSFAIPSRGWEPFDAISINKSYFLSQGAEAIIYWTVFPDGVSADPCAPLRDQPPNASSAELADAVAAAPGTELVAGPTDVTVGGRAGKHVVVTIRDDLGCDPGFFFAWDEPSVGAMWEATGVGSSIWVWIVDVDGTRLFIVGETHAGVGPFAAQEIQGIVDSIRFE